MWKVIQKEQIKGVPVGGKIRVNRVETTITQHYSSVDYGFDTEHFFPYHYENGNFIKVYTYPHQAWDDLRNTVEVWQDTLEEGIKALEEKHNVNIVYTSAPKDGFVPMGSRVKVGGEEYILALVGFKHLVLVNLNTGNRRDDAPLEWAWGCDVGAESNCGTMLSTLQKEFGTKGITIL
jgi:hypothetical protein